MFINNNYETLCNWFSCLISQAADLTKPLDKRVYKGTIPTCHDFNLLTRSSESLELLIGFSAGQVQLLDPIRHEVNKLFNEDVSNIILVIMMAIKVMMVIIVMMMMTMLMIMMLTRMVMV